MDKRIVMGVLAVLALSGLGGCGMFKSSTSQASFESSSKFSSSPFKSSSPDKETKAAYRRDVRDYARTFAASGGNLLTFQRDLSAIAESHGVTNWEQQEGTYVAIGEGLAQVGMSRMQFDEFTRRLCGPRTQQAVWMTSGYQTTLVP
jgi:hypothetical protein